jgi:hypothetical protein
MKVAAYPHETVVAPGETVIISRDLDIAASSGDLARDEAERGVREPRVDLLVVYRKHSMGSPKAHCREGAAS